jgi:enamine deaminase RidA (YjgF/YER057c/UK114 family)
MTYQQFVDAVPSRTELSQAVRVGNLVFCSGQIGVGVDGKIIDPNDARAQIVQAFTNLRTVLENAGASLEHVVKITSFLVNETDRGVLVELRRQFFKPPYPASTLVVVKSLARPEYLYEIEAIAIIR